MNLSYADVCAEAEKGKCPEIQGRGVCQPWVPDSVDQWHPDLMNSVRSKMEEDGAFDQAALDERYLLAAALRILVERRVTKLLVGGSAEADRHRRKFLEELRDQVVDRIGDVVPFYVSKKGERFSQASMSPELKEDLGEMVKGATKKGIGGRTATDPQPTTSSSAASSMPSASSSSAIPKPRPKRT